MTPGSTRPHTALAAAVVLLLTVGLVVQPTAEAQPQTAPARVIDRTLLCSTASIGGVYEIDVRAHAGVRRGRSGWLNLPFAVVSTGQTASRANTLLNALAWVSAGRPAHETNLPGDYGIVVPAQTYGTLALNASVCQRATTRVRLTARGLEGGPADQLGDSAECRTPPRVLVRVRAVSQVQSPFYRDGPLLKTKTALTAGYVAVRTPAGKPLAFAAVFRSGKARLFVASSCVAE